MLTSVLIDVCVHALMPASASVCTCASSLACVCLCVRVCVRACVRACACVLCLRLYALRGLAYAANAPLPVGVFAFTAAARDAFLRRALPHLSPCAAAIVKRLANVVSVQISTCVCACVYAYVRAGRGERVERGEVVAWSGLVVVSVPGEPVCVCTRVCVRVRVLSSACTSVHVCHSAERSVCRARAFIVRSGRDLTGLIAGVLDAHCRQEGLAPSGNGPKWEWA